MLENACGALVDSAIRSTLWKKRGGKTKPIFVTRSQICLKTHAGLHQNCHVLNRVKQQCGDSIFKQTSGFTKVALFENACRGYKEIGVYSTPCNKHYRESLSTNILFH